jgi:hypothetical protein
LGDAREVVGEVYGDGGEWEGINEAQSLFPFAMAVIIIAVGHVVVFIWAAEIATAMADDAAAIGPPILMGFWLGEDIQQNVVDILPACGPVGVAL